MKQPSSCLDDSDLHHLMKGEVDSDAAAGWLAHLEHCPVCFAKAQQVSSIDRLVATLSPEQAQPAIPSADTKCFDPIKQTLSDHGTHVNSLGINSKVTAEFEAWGFLAKPEAPDEIGRLASYRVLKVLGQGGMGVVFQAEDPSLQRLIALKVMLPSVANSSDAKQRFIREARATAALNHENIVHIYQVSEDRGIPFIAMEFLQGETLDDRLKRNPQMPLSEVAQIGRQIAEGLAVAHQKELIHRDIKPSNIWLESKTTHAAGPERVKILDFGLARQASDQTQLTQSGMIVGTPAYMAPEQATGQDLDPRCDLFSLGSILYRMSTGVMPFQGKNMLSLLSALATVQPPAPKEIRKDLPANFSALIMHLLAKDPEKRPAHALQVAEALRAFEDPDHPPRSQTTAAFLAPLPLRPRTLGMKLIALSLLFCALLVAGVVFFMQTPEGTIRVEVKDPKFKVALDQDEIKITEADGKLIRVKPGNHRLHIERDGFSFDALDFMLKKHENTVVSVEWLDQGKVEVRRDGQVIGSQALPKNDPVESIKMGIVPTPQDNKLFAALLSADFEWSTPENLGPAINSPANEVLQGITEDELTLVLARDGKLMISERKSKEEPFPAPEPLSINSEMFGNASITGDGLELVLGNRQKNNQEEILISKRASRKDRFGTPVTMPQSLAAAGRDRHAIFSPDGLSLLVTNGDLFVYQRKSRQEPFSKRMRLPEPVNTTYWDMPVWISNDHRFIGTKVKALKNNIQKLTFWFKPTSDSPYVSLDLAPWLKDTLAMVHITQDGQRMYYNAEIVDGLGKGDIWMVRRVPKSTSPPIFASENKAKQAAAIQMKSVIAKLKQRNPRFDGEVIWSAKEGVITEVEFRSHDVTDISPLASLKGLQKLTCNTDDFKIGRVKDLSPLRGLPLVQLDLYHNIDLEDLTPLKSMKLESLTIYVCQKVRDLSALQGMPLSFLDAGDTAIADLKPLRGMPLTFLNLWKCKNVTDLAPLEGLPLQYLNIQECPATNLTPLGKLPLITLFYQPRLQRDEMILRDIRSLEKINDIPATQYWKLRENP